MPMPPSRPTPERPAVDEWGVYDPERAGLSALYARLFAAPHPAASRPAAAEPAKPASHLPKTPPDR